MKRFVSLSAATLVGLVLAACADTRTLPTASDAEMTAARNRADPFSLGPANSTLFRGDSLPLTLAVRGRPAPERLARATRWTSSNPSVATVRADGLVHATGWGSATITATLGTNRATTTLRVTAPPAVVLLVGDGMGMGALQAARLRAGPLFLDGLPVHGSVSTSSSSHRITDSGAAATALAAGVLTYNGAIGVGPDGAPLPSILESAERRGMATGLVATSSLTHATPAAFAAHVVSRSQEAEIARQMTASGVDVLLGGGRRYFSAHHRTDGLDLVAPFRARGCAVVATVAEAVEAAGTADCVLGLVADGHMPAAPARGGALAGMASAALATLDRDRDGFFLMVEGSQIDWAGHANDGEWSIAEMLDFDDAVRSVVAALGGRPNTLVVVTADHETGGLAARAGAVPGGVAFTWSTSGHTDAHVPLRALGDGASGLSGRHHVDGVGRFLISWMQGR